MLGIIAHWDHKPTMPIEWLRHSYQMFDYAARSYNVDQLVFVDPHGTLSILNPPNKIVDSIDKAIALFDTNNIIHYLHKDGPHNIFTYKHPENAIYIVGPDYNALLVSNGVGLHIPMANPKMELWASQTVSILLSHRYTQWQ